MRNLILLLVLAGCGGAPPKLAISDDVDFGTIALGGTAYSSVLLQNIGGSPLQINLLQVVGSAAPNFHVDPAPAKALEPKEIYAAPVSFTPSSKTSFEAFFVVDCDDPRFEGGLQILMWGAAR